MGTFKLNFTFFLILFVSILCLLPLRPYQYEAEKTCLIMSYAISFCIYWFVCNKIKFDFFHPIHIYFVFYFFIFFITPLFLIDTQDTLCVDDNVMGACIEATIIVVCALLAFSIGYLSVKNRIKQPEFVEPLSASAEKRILKKSYIIFAVCYTISVYYALSSGKTLLGILSLGSMGMAEMSSMSGDDKMLFMINVSYSLLVPWLFIFTYSRNKIIPIILSYLLVSLFFSYGWRFIIYILVLSFLITRSRVLGKKIKISQVLLLITGLLLFSVFTGAVRNSVRSGEKAEFEGFNTENISHTLESNFNIYQTYYGVVGTYPDKADYFYGQACFVYPFIMWIPRSIWPSKPYGTEFPAGKALLKACPSALKEAMSFPNIYEYYIDFGAFGVILFSFFIGRICRKMLDFYNSKSVFKIICYALFAGFLIQFINRGYIAQLITLFAFLYLPLLLYKKQFKQIK